MPNKILPLTSTHFTNTGKIEPKNKAKHTLTQKITQLIRKARCNYSDKPLSMRSISIPANKPTPYTRKNSEKLSTLDQLYQEKGSEGVFKHLSSKLKGLQPAGLLSVETKNPEETFEAQSIKKYLNNQLEKEINKTISLITKETQLEKLSETAPPHSPFSRHKLFQPLVNARNDLQKKHNLNVFTDQLSNRAQKELLDMSSELRAQLVKSNIYDNNITPENEEILNECAANNYKRNYADLPDNFPTESHDLAKTIIDFNLNQLNEEIQPKEAHIKKATKQKGQKIKEKKKEMKKKVLTLNKKIKQLEKNGTLSALNLEEKYQKLKSSNFDKILEATKTELETQAYVGKLTLDVVRNTLGEENSKSQIDDKWNTIKAELDTEIEKIKNVIIENIHAAQGRKPTQALNKTEMHHSFSRDNLDNNTEDSMSIASDLKNSKSQIDGKWNTIKAELDTGIEKIKNVMIENIHATQGRKPMQALNKTEMHHSFSRDNSDNNTEDSMTIASDLKNSKSQADDKWNNIKGKQDTEIETTNTILADNVPKNGEIDTFHKIETMINAAITNHLRFPQTLTIMPMPSLEIHIHENSDKSITIKYDVQNVRSKVFVIDHGPKLNKLINDTWKEARGY